jgi:hypothetical protein
MKPMSEAAPRSVHDPRHGPAGPSSPDPAIPRHELLVHVGYPKAASTWLQQALFTDGFGFSVPWPDARSLAIEHLALPNSFKFEPRSASEAFEEGLRSASERSLLPVLSDETLCGDPLQRRYHGREIADRIHAVFPGARILICIREQQDLVRSLYREYVKQGGTLPIERFLESERRPPGVTPMYRLDYGDYDAVIAYYQRLFGRDRVLTLPFELLKADPEVFLRRIQKFAGVPAEGSAPRNSANRGLSGATLALRRRLNRFSARPDWTRSRQPIRFRAARKLSLWTERIVPGRLHRGFEQRLKRTIARRLEGRYAPSNRRTAEIIGLDLTRWGYEC